MLEPDQSIGKHLGTYWDQSAGSASDYRHALDYAVVGERAGRQLVRRQDLDVRAADVPDLFDLHA